MGEEKLFRPLCFTLKVGEDEVQANLSGIRNNIERVVANHKELLAGKKTLPELEIVNNEDWYRDMNVMAFMGKVGRRLRISRMLGRFESIS